MNILRIESFFNNAEFFLLIFSTLFYWLQAIITIPQPIGGWGRWMMVGANFFALGTLLSRWLNGHHVPLSNQT